MTLINESSLPKGQLRKLNALRKSVGNDIGERAFAEWLAAQPPPAPKSRFPPRAVTPGANGIGLQAPGPVASGDWFARWDLPGW